MCLTKYQLTAFLNYCQLYIVHCDMQSLFKKKFALICFLDGFGNAVPLFSYWAWNMTMDKPIHEREHNDCQQLITKSHDRS